MNNSYLALCLALCVSAPSLCTAQASSSSDLPSLPADTPPASTARSQLDEQKPQSVPDTPAALSEEETRFKWLFRAHFAAAGTELTDEEEDDVDLFAILGQRAIDRMDPESIPAALRSYALELSALIRQYHVPLFPNKLPFSEYIAEVKKIEPHFEALAQRYPEAEQRFNDICNAALYDELPSELREANQQAEERIFADKSLSRAEQIKRERASQSKLLLDWLEKTKP